MSKTLRNWLIALGVIVILGGWAVSSHNNFVALDVNVDTSWAAVEAQYQRRFDLIPNIVNSTKAVLAQEQKVFGDIAEARTRYAGAVGKNTAESVAAANQLESAVARLLVVMENYPQLKSNETVQVQIAELAGTENRITVARERYNETVSDLNKAVRSFPSNLIGKMFGFEEKEMFKAAPGTEKAPVVDMTITQ